MAGTKTRPKSVAEYIDQAPKEARTKLREMRKTIRAVAPGAEEELKWRMPSYTQGRILVCFAAFKHHIGFFPAPSAITAFKRELAGFKTSRATVQLPLEKPMPLALIRKMTKFRLREVLEKDGKWRG